MAELIPSLILVVFAVFGLYCLIRLIWECVYTPKGMTVALVISSPEDVRELSDRLSEIGNRLSVPRGTVLVFVPEHLNGDPALSEELEASIIGYDADVVVYREEA